MRFADAERPVEVARLHELVLEWQFAMQMLSSVFNPVLPVVLTVKPLQEQWHLSSKVVSAAALVAMIFPRQPSFRSRLHGTPAQFEPLLRQLTFHYRVLPTRRNTEKWRSFVSCLRDPQLERVRKLDRVLALWNECHYRGGLLFSSNEAIWGSMVGHLSYLVATFRAALPVLATCHTVTAPSTPSASSWWATSSPNSSSSHCSTPTSPTPPSAAHYSIHRSRVFLIADPEIASYKVLTFHQMIDMIAEPSIGFDLADTC
jgi:hypothetical protein